MAYIFIKSTEVTYELVCCSCHSVFPVKSIYIDKFSNNIVELMPLSGNRKFPFMLKFILAIWFLFILFPFIGFVMWWQSMNYQIFLGKKSKKMVSILKILTILVNAFYVIFIFIP
jgi:hypothetical protein